MLMEDRVVVEIGHQPRLSDRRHVDTLGSGFFYFIQEDHDNWCKRLQDSRVIVFIRTLNSCVSQHFVKGPTGTVLNASAAISGFQGYRFVAR